MTYSVQDSAIGRAPDARDALAGQRVIDDNYFFRVQEVVVAEQTGHALHRDRMVAPGRDAAHANLAAVAHQTHRFSWRGHAGLHFWIDGDELAMKPEHVGDVAVVLVAGVVANRLAPEGRWTRR